MTYLIGWVSMAGAAPWPAAELERQVARAGGEGAIPTSAAYVPVTGFPGVTGVIVGRYTHGEVASATLLTVYTRDGEPWVSAPFALGPADDVRVVGALGLGSEGVLARASGGSAAKVGVDPVLIVERDHREGDRRHTDGWVLSLADPKRPERLAVIEVAVDLGVWDAPGAPPQRSHGWAADRYEVRAGDAVRELVVVGHDRPTPDGGCRAPDQVRRYRIVGRSLEALPVMWADVSCR